VSSNFLKGQGYSYFEDHEKKNLFFLEISYIILMRLLSKKDEIFFINFRNIFSDNPQQAAGAGINFVKYRV